MEKFIHRIKRSIANTLILVALSALLTASCFAASISDNAKFKGEAIDKKGSRFPSTFQITQLDKTTGDFTGEITWHSLNSVHKIEGRVTGSTLTFKETEYIRKGGAHLNCEYAFVFDGKKLQGRWIEPRVDNGTAEYSLQ